MKKILLLNQGHTENYGDIAIRETIESFFKNKNYIIDFYPYWSENLVFGKWYNNAPNLIKKILWHNIKTIDILNNISIKKLKNLSKYDAAIIGGGELLGSHPGFNSSLYVWAKLLDKLNIPLYIIGVSGNADMGLVFLERNKKALSLAKKILVRDSNTAKILKERYQVNAKVYPDVVFAYHNICKKRKKISKKSGLVFIPIEYYSLIKNNLKLSNENEYIEYCCNLIISNRESKEPIIITITTKTDEEIAQKIYKYIIEKRKISNVNYIPYSALKDFDELLLKSRLIISARMHALILGLINKCTIKEIPFKDKLKVFGKEYNKSNLKLMQISKKAEDSLNVVEKEIRGNFYDK